MPGWLEWARYSYSLRSDMLSDSDILSYFVAEEPRSRWVRVV